MLVWVFTYKKFYKFKWTSIQFWISVTNEKGPGKAHTLRICHFIGFFSWPLRS